MDAHALLSSQGWRGHGHSLHKTNDAIGLAKPLLLSRKDNTKGLGTNQHFTSDQWWMNAFDEQLKGLDTSQKGRVVQTVTTGKLNTIQQTGLGKWSLYASFVKGGMLAGTASNTGESESSSESDGDDSESQKRATKAQVREETKEERSARKEAKRRRKAARAERRAARQERRSKSKKAESKSDASDNADEEKRRRRAKKEEKRRLREKKDSGSK